MKRKLISIFIFCTLFINGYAVDQINQRCECGDYSAGITVYWVGVGEICCRGTATAAMFYYYEEESPGMWTEIGHYDLPDAPGAQGSCCNPS